MQVTNFIKYLDNSSLFSSVSEEEIKPLLDEFPYCQTGQLMQAIYLNNNSSILFEQQLKKAASYCTDRNKLFEHLHQENISTPVEVIKEEKADPIVEQISSETPDIQKMDVLEKQYLTAAISSSILLESETVAPEETNKVVEVESSVEVTIFNSNEGHTFSDWLKHYNGDDLTGEEIDSSSQTKQFKQDLIDKFIQEDPKIQPKKTEFYSPTNMARLSVVDDSDIVSETLALIYVDQGKYHEAISAYKRLSLKNPKKSSYFASQIKILNQKIK